LRRLLHPHFVEKVCAPRSLARRLAAPHFAAAPCSLILILNDASLLSDGLILGGEPKLAGRAHKASKQRRIGLRPSGLLRTALPGRLAAHLVLAEVLWSSYRKVQKEKSMLPHFWEGLQWSRSAYQSSTAWRLSM